MDKHIRLLTIEELRVGMITAQEVKANGRVLIGSGVSITDQAISKLKDAYFDNRVEVYSELNFDSSGQYNERLKTVEEIEKSFTELSFDMKQLFENMTYLQSSDMEEVRKFAARIQQELQSTSSVIKNIVLYGSGRDTIYRHGVNVAALSTLLGKWIGLNENKLNLLTYSAVLHDFGKVKIDKNILDKPGELTAEEFNFIKQHPTIGYNYIKNIRFLDKSVALGVLMHHERVDGSGYPLGIEGKTIHEFAKIIAIADVFDAVNSDRIYKKSQYPFEALRLIQEESFKKLDYEYCNVFLSHIVNYYLGETVSLNNGDICRIIQIDVNNIGRPLLLDDTDFIDLNNQKDLFIEKFIS